MPTVESWPLEASLWDREVLAGPAPSLFSEDSKSSEDALIGNIPQKESHTMDKFGIYFTHNSLMVNLPLTGVQVKS